jgi:hypothetical protein
MKKQTSRSVRVVQVETKGREVVELISQREVHEPIWSIGSTSTWQKKHQSVTV